MYLYKTPNKHICICICICILGAFAQLMCPHHGEFAHFLKKKC